MNAHMIPLLPFLFLSAVPRISGAVARRYAMGLPVMNSSVHIRLCGSGCGKLRGGEADDRWELHKTGAPYLPHEPRAAKLMLTKPFMS
jgi:hypothetical protein